MCVSLQTVLCQGGRTFQTAAHDPPLEVKTLRSRPIRLVAPPSGLAPQLGLAAYLKRKKNGVSLNNASLNSNLS